MSGRLVIMIALGLAALVLAFVLLTRESGPFAGPLVVMEDVTAAHLDTATVRGQRVEASLSGVVVEVAPSGDVWVSAGGDAFALRFPEAPDLTVEDHVLAVGRLRARGGRRWLAVESWVRLDPSVRPPPAPEL